MEDLKNFDIENLDLYERMVYDDLIKNISKENALQVIINNVEGDLTQLSEELSQIAKKLKNEN